MAEDPENIFPWSVLIFQACKQWFTFSQSKLGKLLSEYNSTQT